jgi:hypothetical protein
LFLGAECVALYGDLDKRGKGGPRGQRKGKKNNGRKGMAEDNPETTLVETTTEEDFTGTTMRDMKYTEP